MRDGANSQKLRTVEEMRSFFQPQILILDEPINGLDPSGIVEFRSILQQLNEQKNITILSGQLNGL